MSVPVFLAQQLSPVLADLQVNQQVTWQGTEAHHGLTVQRLVPGQELDLVDGCGLRMRMRILNITKNSAQLEAITRIQEPKLLPELVLVQALAKGGRDEQAVETATEVGVDIIIPWQSQRCISRWNGAKAEKGHRKWTQICQAGAKQSRRAHWPVVEPLRETNKLCGLIKNATKEGALVLLAHEQAQRSLMTVLVDGDISRPHSQIWVIVGPEGGITATEVESLQAAGARLVRLTRQVLRTSTAGPIALGVIGAHVGLWASQVE